MRSKKQGKRTVSSSHKNHSQDPMLVGEIITKTLIEKFAQQEIVAKLRKENNRLRLRNRKLEDLATKDELTGLLNKRGIKQELERSVKHFRRERPDRTTAFSILALDLDDFKKLNDTQGHHAGDRALCAIAEILTEAFNRGTDIVGRCGDKGDEFFVILSDTDIQQGERKARGFADVARVDPRLAFGQIRISASIGAVEWNLDPKTDMRDAFDGLIQAQALADNALYRSKDERKKEQCDYRITILAPAPTKTPSRS